MVKKFGFVHFDFYRDVIVSLLRKKGKKATKLNASKLGNELRKKYGKGIMGKLLAEKILKKVKRKKKAKIVITGIRSKAEIKEFERVLKTKLVLIEIYAPKKERFKRCKGLSWKDFVAREKLDKGKGLDEVLKMADYRVRNVSRREMHQKLKEIISKLLN